MICCKGRKEDPILPSAAVVVNAHNRAMQYVVFWGGRCKRLVDGSELGVAVPKIRELSKVPMVVSAQPDRCLRRGWLNWGLEEEPGYAGPDRRLRRTAFPTCSLGFYLA